MTTLETREPTPPVVVAHPHRNKWAFVAALLIAIAAIAVVVFVATRGSSSKGAQAHSIPLPIIGDAQKRAQDRAAQSDLRNGLTAEKTIYTDNQEYSANASDMKEIESSLDWGGKLTVVVGDAFEPGDKGTVCLSEASESGTVFELADVAAGENAGTYYGTSACPTKLVPADLASHLSSSWDGSSTPSFSIPAVPRQTQVESDLGNALTAEKTLYTDQQAYSSDTKELKSIEPDLDWGGGLTVVVGDAVSAGDGGVVCVSEKTSDGASLAIADVAAGPRAGTYFGNAACPADPNAANVAKAGFAASW